jgi:hypothetical protein
MRTEQKDLAAAVQVTESYISQLLTRKKAPSAPGCTGTYEKTARVLKIPSGDLSNLAELQRDPSGFATPGSKRFGKVAFL